MGAWFRQALKRPNGRQFHILFHPDDEVLVIRYESIDALDVEICPILYQDKPAVGQFFADRIHFCRYIYWALDGVRRRVQKNWNDYDRKKGKRMRYVFHNNSEKLTEEDRWYLNRYLKMDDELKRAYELKEAYCVWFQDSKKRGPEDVLKTKVQLYEFRQLVAQSGIPEFQKAMRTFDNWQTEILNSFAFPYSNGFLEGINNLTKVIKRNAFGFQNFERARAKILLIHKYKNIGVHVG